MEYTGGCFCENVRYRITTTPDFPHLCSCRNCQRWSGAPAVAWLDFPGEGLSWIGPSGEPKWYRESAVTRRGFCDNCGGTLCAVDDDSDVIGITTATLDDSSFFEPISHSFKELKPKWMRISLARK